MILYAASLSPHSSNTDRLRALERAGEHVLPLNTLDFYPSYPFLRSLYIRLAAGPGAARLNREILCLAAEHRPELFWADKVLWLQPHTLDALRRMGITTVSYVMDNPFGPRNDPGWRLHLRNIPHFDLHVVQRDRDIVDYKTRGARDVLKIQTAFEPTIHFPPPTGWTDADRNREVSFIGSPYDNRASLLQRLAQTGLPIAISGNPAAWSKTLKNPAFSRLFREGELLGPHYRETIWRSKINLSFLTHSNNDEFAHKSFEIAACGSFLLAERSAGHTSRFLEDQEAVFFTGIDELHDKITRYLPDETSRARIAAAGHARAIQSGYDNDTQVAHILVAARKR